MDRSVFTELMSKPVEVISKDEAKEIMRKSIFAGDSYHYNHTKSGILNEVIVMEECAELAQSISKHIRGIGNKESLIEEMADVAVGLDYLKMLEGVTDDELQKAYTIKIRSLAERLNAKEN